MEEFECLGVEIEYFDAREVARGMLSSKPHRVMLWGDFCQAPHSRRETNDCINGETSDSSAEEERKIGMLFHIIIVNHILLFHIYDHHHYLHNKYVSEDR